MKAPLPMGQELQEKANWGLSSVDLLAMTASR